MGIIRDFINAKVVGSEVRKGIKTVQGRENKKRKPKSCDYCGKKTNEIIAECQFKGSRLGFRWGCITRDRIINAIKQLCKDCAKKCNKCGKYFCPEHIKKHKER